MNEPVVLYYNPMSRARIVHWLLEELGVPYRLELLSFDRALSSSAIASARPMSTSDRRSAGV